MRKTAKREATDVKTIVRVIELDQGEQPYSAKEIGIIVNRSSSTVNAIRRHLDHIKANPDEIGNAKKGLLVNVEKAWKIWKDGTDEMSATGRDMNKEERDQTEIKSEQITQESVFLKMLEEMQQMNEKMTAVNEMHDRLIFMIGSIQQSNLDIRKSSFQAAKGVAELVDILK